MVPPFKQKARVARDQPGKASYVLTSVFLREPSFSICVGFALLEMFRFVRIVIDMGSCVDLILWKKIE